MIQMDRQLLTMIAAAVCVAACIYLFKEMKQAKEDVDGLKMVQTKMMHMLTPPPQPRPFGMPTSPPPPPPPPMPTQKQSTMESAPEIDESVDDIAEEK